MKNAIIRSLALALCAALLCALPVFAAEEAEVPMKPDYPAPVQVWGTVTRQEDGGLLLENPDESDPYREIVVYLGDAPVVDAVSGLPLDASGIKDGDTVYAWVGPAMTLSLPPQASALVVVANIPADFAAPRYYEIAAIVPQAVIAIYPAPPITWVELVAAGGERLHITKDAELTPYLTKQIVRLEDLVPGTRMLVWSGADGAVTRVVVFSYEYRGYISWTDTGDVRFNDGWLSVAGKNVDSEVLLPLRAVAEAAGYDVEWVSGKGAVVFENGETVLTAMPGGESRTAEGELPGTCVLEKGVTYLSAGTLARALELYPGIWPDEL